MLTKLEQEIIKQITPESTHLYCNPDVYLEVIRSMFCQELYLYYHSITMKTYENQPMAILVVMQFFGDLEIHYLEDLSMDFLVSPTIFGGEK
jgi:hypothetical protein